MLLYVDGLNFCMKWLPKYCDPWNIFILKTNITKFVTTCASNGVELAIFLDATRSTSEATKKFLSRHEVRIAQDKVDGIPLKETMIGDVFRMVGVPVYYSYKADNDDTLAAYAERDNATVLSKDQDYFRYAPRRFRIFSDYYYKKKGGIGFIRSEENEKRQISKRKLLSLSNLPMTIDHSPELADISEGFYRKGPGTPLLKIVGKESPYLTVRPLRQALYHKFGLESITEILPIWNFEKKRVDWTNDLVPPSNNPFFLGLLERPNDAVLALFSSLQFVRPDGISDDTWRLHLFSCVAVCHNLAALASGGKILTFETLEPVASRFLQTTGP